VDLYGKKRPRRTRDLITRSINSMDCPCCDGNISPNTQTVLGTPYDACFPSYALSV
jgi:hypothetical protein